VIADPFFSKGRKTEQKGRKAERMRLAQIGHGYWGKNLMRVFSSVPGAQMAVCCDSNPAARSAVQALYPSVKVSDDFEQVLRDSDIDAVIIATLAGQHYDHVKRALQAGKHVFVEKPLARTVEEARELVALVESSGLTLMVGHTFLFNDAVRWVKDYIDSGKMGRVYYAYFQRLNLGRVRQDVDVMWNLAPHDISIANYWFAEEPSSVRAHGVSFLQPGIADVAFLNIRYPSDRYAHIHVSWLDPSKTRRAVIVGSEKMILYDDTSSEQPITVYDKGIDRKQLATELGDFSTFDQFQLIHRAGDVWIPRIQFREPLQVQAAHFVECVTQGRRPLSDERNGLQVVETLAAAQASYRDE
jgi:predicted dehydrogenase